MVVILVNQHQSVMLVEIIQGEMGTGSNTAHGSASGNRRLKEIEFDSSPEIMTTAHEFYSGHWYKSTFDSGGSNQNRMKIGRIVKVMQHGHGSNTTFSVYILDEFGQVYDVESGAQKVRFHIITMMILLISNQVMLTQQDLLK